MKTSKIIAVAALSLAAAVGAQAEEYQGVLTVNSTLSRAETQQQAIAAARAVNAYGDASANAARAQVVAQRDRATVRAEAIRAAAAPDQNVVAGSRVNSKVISTLDNPVDARARVEGGASKL